MSKYTDNEKKHIHFIGIGGISMSSLAKMLLNKGYRVSGSDNAESKLTEDLEKDGATIFIGQRETNITEDIDTIVYTAAIHPDNPEFKAAKDSGKTIISRAELLGDIMEEFDNSVAVAGTHGKTTTTSMISEILMKADRKPTLSLGGILPSIKSNYLVGNSDYFVTEACEYTNSYHSLKPKIALILNVEADHLDYFKDLDDIRASFAKFAGNVKEDGTIIISGDIQEVNQIYEKAACKKIIKFGNSGNCDYRAQNIAVDNKGNYSFEVDKDKFKLAVPGKHNVLNALAAICTADILGIDRRITAEALAGFKGTERRFEYKGEWNNLNNGEDNKITIIDDYAHHPTEIKATIEAAKKYPHRDGGLWIVFQPHTYTRTKALLPEFAEALSLADNVILSEIYAARETDNLGISSKDIADILCEKGKNAHYMHSFEEIENFLKKNCVNDDLLITMGAGDIYKIGQVLLEK